MRITSDQLQRFNDMAHEFARKHQLRSSIDHHAATENSDPQTIIYFDDPRDCVQAIPYIVKWNEVRSLTDAATTVFSDVMCKFGIAGTDSFKIKNVIFNAPATIVVWEDGTKTVVKCQDGDIYSEETGLAMAIAKKALGNRGNFNNVFKKWIPEHEAKVVIGDVKINDITIQQTEAFDRSIAAIKEAVNDSFNKFLNKRGRGLV